MFRQLTDIKFLAGKTISRTQTMGARIFVFFSDNSFCIFTINRLTIADSRVEIETEVFDQEPVQHNCYLLRELGFISDHKLEETILKYKRNKNG